MTLSHTQQSEFSSLGLSPELLRSVRESGYLTPTPIQSRAIPVVLEGRDVVGCAQTGSGKTAAFALPILDRLSRKTSSVRGFSDGQPRCLVLAPTRELALQIDTSFTDYGRFLPLSHTVIFGGVNEGPQLQALRRKPAVVVATPGRLLDFMTRGLVSFRSLEILVLDEVDRMLDMGFLPDMRKILKEINQDRQTLFFSATFPPTIRSLAKTLLRDPVEVSVAPTATTVETVDQRVFIVARAQKREALKRLLKDKAARRVLVFTRTKHGANRVCEILCKSGFSAAAFHSNKSQNARQKALEGFKEGQIRVLVASDIAARGIDIDDVTHVVNYDLPDCPETYVHRIGRTARAGSSGIAISFCEHEERDFIRQIEKSTRQTLAMCSLPA